MSEFTVEHLKDADTGMRIGGDEWKLAHYDASNGKFRGRFEVFRKGRDLAWHYYELKPDEDGVRKNEAQVFYGAMKKPHKLWNVGRNLTDELAVVAEKCHEAVRENRHGKWKRLAAPIIQGVAVEKVAHAS